MTTDHSSAEHSLPLRCRGDVIAEPMVLRAERRWHLKDPVTTRYWQLGDEEFFLWRQLDGHASLADLQARFARRFAPCQIDCARLHQFIGQLHREGLVLSDAPGQAETLLTRHDEQRSRDRLLGMSNLLAMRFRGVDPEPLLRRLYPCVAWLFSPWTVAASWLLMFSALLLAVTQSDLLAERIPRLEEFFTRDNLLSLAIVLAVVKVAHELGHALTCRHFGGECREMGLMLLVFTPCLYCNVSDAWLLPSKWRRMAIGAAGMWVELTLAAAATWLWWFAQPGLFQSLCLNVMLVSSVSTLLFNGNPLLRYDGYFLLSDWLEWPNLRQDADAWLRREIGGRLLGLEASNPTSTRGGTLTLASFALASFVYRWLLTGVILLLLYHWLAERRLEVLGLLVIFMVIIGLAVPTAWQAYAFCANPLQRRRVRTARVSLSVICVLALLSAMGFIPAPRHIVAPAVIQAAGPAWVYVTHGGTLEGGARIGDVVAADAVLARLRDDELEFEVQRLRDERDFAQLQVEQLRKQQVQDVRTGVAGVAGQLPSALQRLADLEQQLAQQITHREQLTIRAPRGGTVLAARPIPSSPRTGELPGWHGSPLDPRQCGAFLETGTMLCQIGEPQRVEAVLVVDQADVGDLRIGAAVIVRVTEYPQAALAGTITAIASTPLDEPPPELVARQLLPLARKGGELRPLGAFYQVRVELPDRVAIPFGATGHARIAAPSMPLAQRLFAAMRAAF